MKYEEYLKDREESIKRGRFTVVVTFLPLRRRYTLRFLLLVRRILVQLRENQSVISFRLQADFLRSEYVTVSVWDEDEAIGNFVHSPPPLYRSWKVLEMENEGGYICSVSVFNTKGWLEPCWNHTKRPEPG